MTSSPSEDTQNQALENNPCGLCRAMGLAVCKGHGGGSGGGGPDDGSEVAEEHAFKQSDITTSVSLNNIFSESALWNYVGGSDDIYTYEPPRALLSIKLDLGAGSIVFSKHDNLSKKEEQAFNQLLDAVESELNAFKAELEAKGIDTQAIRCQRENGCLTIKLPKPEYFDSFVQRLTDKNLLVTTLPQKEHALEAATIKHQHTPQPQKQTEINIEEALTSYSDELRQLADTHLQKNENGHPENIYKLGALKAYFEDGLLEMLDQFKDNNFEEDDEEVLDWFKNQGKVRLSELSTQCSDSFKSAPEAIQEQVHLILSEMDSIYDKGVNEIAELLNNKPNVGPQ